MDLKTNEELIQQIQKPSDLHWTTDEEQAFLFCERTNDVKAFIQKSRAHGLSWKVIYYGKGQNDSDLDAFIEKQKEDNFWEITSSEYKYLTWLMFDIERRAWPSRSKGSRELIMPTHPTSAWKCYEATLRDNPNFTYKSIASIEDSTKYLLSFMVNQNGTDVIKRDVDDPVRGIVVGNVQSGKTANMEALIATASDFHFNFFVVLTGTIENLRKQTRDRITSDFVNKMGNKYGCRYIYSFIDNPSAKSPSPDRLEDLNLEPDSNRRYICVCLKNSKRLAHLVNWINKNPANKAKLNVLFIDDEADQASLNTANIGKKKISRINGEIKQIVFGKDSKDIATPYGSFVYAGYTATPYGNFLNEADKQSLYPTDFIYGLKTNGDYIGPKQFFGTVEEGDGDSDKYDTLPLVNEIPDEEVEDIKDNTSFNNSSVPIEMGKAILWFLCTVGLFRKWDLKSPVSMLIHTSQSASEHAAAATGIDGYLRKLEKQPDLSKSIKRVYEEQTKKCSPETFLFMMSDYSNPEKIHKFPPFEEIEEAILGLVKNGVQHIQMGEVGQLVYKDGIHLCIDNCYQDKSDTEEMVMRIVYPETKEDEQKCPAFIVIGGQTLSRGLTLKGLTVSYFLRSTVMADSLMQMGRWFGYRKGYETLERVWLSNKTLTQFEKLTRLDNELRSLIEQYRILNWSPMKYAPQVENFPDYRFLKITSKSKMQKSQVVRCTYANKRGQTTKFFDDAKKIEDNYKKAFDFVSSLDKLDPERIQKLQNPYIATNGYKNIWFNQDYDKVFDFLASLQYPKQAASVDDAKSIKEWFKKQYDKGNLKNFNIVIPSVQKPTTLDSSICFKNGLTLNTVSRTKAALTKKDRDEEVFRIPVITGPTDLNCDIDYSILSRDTVERMAAVNGKSTIKRDFCGMIDTPLLVLYFINKKGGKETLGGTREPLDLSQHLFGYYIYIPSGKDGNAASESVAVCLDFPNEEEDVENEI